MSNDSEIINLLMNDTSNSNSANISGKVSDIGVAPPGSYLNNDAGKVQIPLYSTIFLLAVIGNSLVILTLVQNKRMRTITNVYLLNLAVSDIFIGVFCMPFTLVGTLLRDFIFGEFMCRLLPYLQGNILSLVYMYQLHLYCHFLKLSFGIICYGNR